MSFGTESATPIGGQTLTGFIVSKAMQSRKDAKKEDRKEKRKKKKEDQTKKENKQQQQKQGVGSKLLGSFPSLGNLFSAKKPPTKSAQQTQTRTSGGGTGLAKILTQGFGSLTADTMGVASGLASVTQLLNSSLRAQSFTATGVQTIASILSDQVENQGSILSTVKSLKPGGRAGGGGGRSMFGSSKSSGVGSDTLTGFVWNKIKDQVLAFLGGAVGGQLGNVKNLFKPKEAAAPKPAPALSPKSTGRLTGSYDRFLQGKSNFGDRLRLLRKGQIGPGQMFTKGGVDALAKPPAGGGIRSMFNPKNFKLPNLGGLKNVQGGRGGLLGTAALLGAEIFKPQIQEASSKMWESLGVGPTAMSDEELQREYSHEKQKIERARAYRQQNPLLNMAGEPEGVLDTYNVLRGEMQKRKLNLASGGVMIGEAGKEAVVDLNSNHGKNVMGQQKGDPGMKASGASTLAVVDQFIKGMGPLGAPVSQALGPDIQNLSRTFGMSQSLPNLKIGGGKFKEDGNAKKMRDKFLEELISGSLDALDAKKKDDKKVEGAGAPPPTGDKNQKRSQERQQETKEMIESIPGAGKAMERVTPEGIKRAEGEQAYVSENKVKGTQVQLASGDKLMVPSADLNPVVGSNKKYWYDNKGQIYRWKPGENVTGLYLDEVHRQGKADGFDLVRDLNTGVVRKVSVKPDWNPFNNANLLKNGEYSYRANDKLIDNRNKTPVWSRANEKQDIGGLHGPEIAIPKQSNLTSFQRGGQVEQKPWWDFMGKFVDNHRNTKPQDYSNQKGLGANFARRREMMKELGYEKGGSMFGTEASRVTPLEQRVKALEDIISITAITSATEPKNKAPKSRPASVPTGATSESSSDMSSAAIINIVGGMGGGASIPTSSQSSQDSTDYISDPWPGGLAGVLCSSPWSAV